MKVNILPFVAAVSCIAITLSGCGPDVGKGQNALAACAKSSLMNDSGFVKNLNSNVGSHIKSQYRDQNDAQNHMSQVVAYVKSNVLPKLNLSKAEDMQCKAEIEKLMNQQFRVHTGKGLKTVTIK